MCNICKFKLEHRLYITILAKLLLIDNVEYE